MTSRVIELRTAVRESPLSAVAPRRGLAAPAVRREKGTMKTKRKLGRQGLEARPGLHGDEPVLRACGRPGIDRHDPSGHRPRHHVLRYRGGLRTLRERGAP